MRITRKFIEAKITNINRLLNRPATYSTRDPQTGKLKRNVGYFGVEVSRMDGQPTSYTLEECTNVEGGVSVRIPSVLGSSNFALALDAFIAGIYSTRDNEFKAACDPDELPTNHLLYDAARKSEFVRAYLDAIEFTEFNSNSELGDTMNLDAFSYSLSAAILHDCAVFQAGMGELHDGDESDAAHDFWLTRNGHGAGFWDGDWPIDGARLDAFAKAFGEVEMYRGDDGKIYA